jgi:hypothetical protein
MPYQVTRQRHYESRSPVDLNEFRNKKTYPNQPPPEETPVVYKKSLDLSCQIHFSNYVRCSQSFCLFQSLREFCPLYFRNQICSFCIGRYSNFDIVGVWVFRATSFCPYSNFDIVGPYGSKWVRIISKFILQATQNTITYHPPYRAYRS